MKIIKTTSWILLLILIGCKHSGQTAEDKAPVVKTPVTITSVTTEPMADAIDLTAVSAYQKKNPVTSSLSGFIESVSVNPGDYMTAGHPMYTIKTKEAKALSQYNPKDSNMTFTGEIKIDAPTSGIVTEVNKMQNDFVNEGDQLAIIADQSSFVFLLNVPYEFNKYASIGAACEIVLPDSTHLKGTISSKVSSVDATAQTQGYVVKVQTNTSLPENLIASVRLNKSTKPDAQVIEKSAVLSDETMENFWVMKLVNDTTAVKTPVKIGISSGGKTEILSPVFKPTDRIVLSGNYGLPDTAIISVNTKTK